jgi:hypothetical protein
MPSVAAAKSNGSSRLAAVYLIAHIQCGPLVSVRASEIGSSQADYVEEVISVLWCRILRREKFINFISHATRQPMANTRGKLERWKSLVAAWVLESFSEQRAGI